VVALIVGDRADGHVQAVLEVLARSGSTEPLVIDAPSLQKDGFSLTLDRVGHAGLEANFARPDETGWLRRYAPTAWGQGSVIGDLDAVTKRAFMALVGTISRLGQRQWLTPLDRMLAAEDRLVQLEAARHLNLEVPATIVTSDPLEAQETLGQNFVVKPLSGGYYWRGGKPQAVYTSLLTPAELSLVDFGAAPFVAQEALRVITHYRAVTVRDAVWVAELGAEGRPLDWRQQEAAHFSWVVGENNDVGVSALRLAELMQIGYSSQDWVFDGERYVFLDLNPGGQWMFLPEAISRSVTQAIASFLNVQ
jgi:hypothetical protein